MKEEPFKYYNDLKRAYQTIPVQEPDEFFSVRVMAEAKHADADLCGLVPLAERFLASAFISMGFSLASCIYLVSVTAKALDSVEVFSVMGLFGGNLGM
jgi:hypothetical protein